jgi:hypothetical protein
MSYEAPSTRAARLEPMPAMGRQKVNSALHHKPAFDEIAYVDRFNYSIRE